MWGSWSGYAVHAQIKLPDVTLELLWQWISYIGGIDAQLGRFLLDVIDQQSQNGSLLITSQYPRDKWYDLFSDPTIAGAILDRIIYKAHE